MENYKIFKLSSYSSQRWLDCPWV